MVNDDYNNGYGSGYGNSGTVQYGVGWQQCVNNHDSLDNNEDDENFVFLRRSYYVAIDPFAQARNAAQQEEEEEHADPNLRQVTIKRRTNGLRSSTEMDFMRLRNDSYLAQINVYLSQSSKEIHMTSGVFGLSNTKHLRRNAVLC